LVGWVCFGVPARSIDIVLRSLPLRVHHGVCLCGGWSESIAPRFFTLQRFPSPIPATSPASRVFFFRPWTVGKRDLRARRSSLILSPDRDRSPTDSLHALMRLSSFFPHPAQPVLSPLPTGAIPRLMHFLCVKFFLPGRPRCQLGLPVLFSNPPLLPSFGFRFHQFFTSGVPQLPLRNLDPASKWTPLRNLVQDESFPWAIQLLTVEQAGCSSFNLTWAFQGRALFRLGAPDPGISFHKVLEGAPLKGHWRHPDPCCTSFLTCKSSVFLMAKRDF